MGTGTKRRIKTPKARATSEKERTRWSTGLILRMNRFVRFFSAPKALDSMA